MTTILTNIGFSRDSNWSLGYECTNESIPGIVAGLELKEEDRIFAVSGSGDQAFAMLEYVDFVQAVDHNPMQVNYAQKRVRQIRDGDFEGFYKVGYMWEGTRFAVARRNYFTEERLRRVSDRLDRLVITEANIFDICSKEGKFNKFYFSNTFFFFQSTTFFTSLVVAQPIGGLIYAAFNPYTVSIPIPGLILHPLLTPKLPET